MKSLRICINSQWWGGLFDDKSAALLMNLPTIGKKSLIGRVNALVGGSILTAKWNKLYAGTNIAFSQKQYFYDIHIGCKWEFPTYVTLSPKWTWKFSGKGSGSLAIEYTPFRREAPTSRFDRPNVQLA